jgi:hypothetical protein
MTTSLEMRLSDTIFVLRPLLAVTKIQYSTSYNKKKKGLNNGKLECVIMTENQRKTIQ